MNSLDWTKSQRIIAGVIGSFAAVAITAQTALTVQAIMADGESLSFALVRISGYFTVWNNCLVAVVGGMIVAGKLTRHRPLDRIIVGGTAFAITMVGIIYHALLARQFGLHEPQFYTDHGVHTVVPIAMAAFWFWAGAKHSINWHAGLIWLIWPLAYTVQVVVRGLISGWYPYFFLDVGNLGWGQTVLNVLGLLLVFAVMGQIFIAAGKLRAKAEASA